MRRRPTGDTAAGRECRKRSPLAYIEHARVVPLTSITAYLMGAIMPILCLSVSRCARFISSLACKTASPKILYRRYFGNVRITVFDGARLYLKSRSSKLA